MVLMPILLMEKLRLREWGHLPGSWRKAIYTDIPVAEVAEVWERGQMHGFQTEY